MPGYIVVFGRRRMYADHSPRNTAAAMMQVHIRLVFLFGRQMDRSFDILRHRNGRYTITMLTDEGLPGGLILRPLADGGLWNNVDIGLRLVSDDYGIQDMGLRGVNENNNDVDDGANSANENNNDENVNDDNNIQDEHIDENNEGNDDNNSENENEQNGNDDGGTGDGVIDLTYSNDSTNSANENNEDENDNDINNHNEHNSENNGGNDEHDGENENEENSNDADGGTIGDGVIDLTYSTDEDERGVNENNDDDGTI